MTVLETYLEILTNFFEILYPPLYVHFLFFYSIVILKKIQFTLYTYVLAKILQNGAKFIQKLTPGFKNHRNLDNFRQAVERPKTWNLMATFAQEIHLSKTYIPSAKTNTEDLSNIIFNYLCENLPNDLCQFWSHKSFFSSVFLWLKHYTLFPQLALKSTKFLMLFFKQKVSFSLKFGSFFSVMRDNISLLFFSWNFISKCKFSGFPLHALKFTKFLISFLESRVSFSSKWKLIKFLKSFIKSQDSFPLNFAWRFNVMKHISPKFFPLKLYALGKKNPSLYNFSDFWVL